MIRLKVSFPFSKFITTDRLFFPKMSMSLRLRSRETFDKTWKNLNYFPPLHFSPRSQSQDSTRRTFLKNWRIVARVTELIFKCIYFCVCQIFVDWVMIAALCDDKWRPRVFFRNARIIPLSPISGEWSYCDVSHSVTFCVRDTDVAPGAAAASWHLSLVSGSEIFRILREYLPGHSPILSLRCHPAPTQSEARHGPRDTEFSKVIYYWFLPNQLAISY